MQAWQQVKVTNPDSQFAGEAGMVVRSEAKGKKVIVTVKLDNYPEDVQTFDATELQILG